MRIETEHTGIDKVKDTIVNQLNEFLKRPNLYKTITQQPFDNCQVHTEFPYRAKHLPLITVSETGSTGQFVDIRAANFVHQISDEETGELFAYRYGGADNLSLAIDIATLAVPQRQKLIDLVKMWFQILSRDTLNREGIQVLAVRLNGTSEVAQDQDPNFVYTANVSVDLWIDWYLDIPVETVEEINVSLRNC